MEDDVIKNIGLFDASKRSLSLSTSINGEL